MKSITIASYGGVEGLEVREVPDPPLPTADRIQVRVRAAGLNRADILQRQGHYPAPPGYPQDIPGLEFAGEVSEVGNDVRMWQLGQRVFGIIGGGGQAQYVTIAENNAAEVPANLSWEEAAAIPEVFMTAHDALFTQCGLKMGESVLIHAAGSGVGTAAIQMAHAAGAIAYGTSRTAHKLDRAAAFGLSGTVVVAEDPSMFVTAIKQWTKDAGVDVVLDLVGAAYLKANMNALARRGRLIFVSTAGGSKGEIDLATAMHKRLRIMGTALRTRSAEEKATATRLFAEQVGPLLASGAVKPVIDSVFHMHDVRAAHQRLESNEAFGKVVLTID